MVLSPLEGWRLAFVQVAGGMFHTCALTNDGVVWCWGRGDGGQLGRGVFEGVEPVGPAPVPGLSGVVGVYAGRTSTCARTGGGQVWCWGGEYLGNGQRGSSATPVQIAGLSGATSLTSDELHACAVFATGGVKCWGSAYGVLGDGTWEEERLYPVSVKTSASTSLLGAAQVSTSWMHTCARLTSGQVWCWGWNECGRVGVEWSATSSGYALFAMQVTTVTGVAEVSASAIHSCARLASGVIKCWGCSLEGLRGDGGVSEEGPTPSTVSGITTAVELSSTWSSTCARLASGGVRCWGGNYRGQLGNGSSAAFSNVPVTVSGGLSSATDLGSGPRHQCAVQGNDVWCWGGNEGGQLGFAAGRDSFSNVPVKVVLP